MKYTIVNGRIRKVEPEREPSKEDVDNMVAAILLARRDIRQIRLDRRTLALQELMDRK